MTKRTQDEINRMVKMAEDAWENAPCMPAKDAARLQKKWNSVAITPKMIEEKKLNNV